VKRNLDVTALVQRYLVGEAVADASYLVLVADEHMRFAAVSDAACELLGYTRHEFLRLTVPDIVVEREAPQDVQDAEFKAGGASVHVPALIAEVFDVSRSEGRRLLELMALSHVWIKLSAPYRHDRGPRNTKPDRAWLAALIAAVSSSILLIAPSAYHRVLFRHHDKEYRVERGTQLALLGMGALALSIACAVFVITDFVFGGLFAAAVMAAAIARSSRSLWFALPFRRRAQLDRKGSDSNQKKSDA